MAKDYKSSLFFVTMEGKGKGNGKGSFTSASSVMVMQQLFQEVNLWYPPGQPFRVIMDNAKQHVSKKSKAELEAMGLPLMKGFPAQSYDMNLIEMAWGHLQQQLLGHNFKKKHTCE